MLGHFNLWSWYINCENKTIDVYSWYFFFFNKSMYSWYVNYENKNIKWFIVPFVKWVWMVFPNLRIYPKSHQALAYWFPKRFLLLNSLGLSFSTLKTLLKFSFYRHGRAFAPGHITTALTRLQQVSYPWAQNDRITEKQILRHFWTSMEEMYNLYKKFRQYCPQNNWRNRR